MLKGLKKLLNPQPEEKEPLLPDLVTFLVSGTHYRMDVGIAFSITVKRAEASLVVQLYDQWLSSDRVTV